MTRRVERIGAARGPDPPSARVKHADAVPEADPNAVARPIRLPSVPRGSDEAPRAWAP